LALIMRRALQPLRLRLGRALVVALLLHLLLVVAISLEVSAYMQRGTRTAVRPAVEEPLPGPRHTPGVHELDGGIGPFNVYGPRAPAAPASE
jgi:hypothetical protein